MKKWIYLVVLLFILTGCRGENNQAQKTNNNNNTNQFMNIKNSTIEQVEPEESENVSKHLANLAASVPNVKGATALAIGKYAIVGIDVDEDIDRSKVGTIKYSVAEVLKHDPHGARAVIVADPDITTRLKEMGEDIKIGKPVQGILNELAEIVGRIMPEVPGNITDPHITNDLDKQKREMNNTDQEQLEMQQQEQSNHQK